MHAHSLPHSKRAKIKQNISFNHSLNLKLNSHRVNNDFHHQLVDVYDMSMIWCQNLRSILNFIFIRAAIILIVASTKTSFGHGRKVQNFAH